MLARASAAGLAGMLLLWTPTAASAESEPTVSVEEVFASDPAGGAVHLASGFPFPGKLAELQAVGPHVFKPDNVMVRYGGTGPSDGEGWLDLFIYPGEGSLDEESAEVGSIIVENYGATSIASPRPLPPFAADARSGWYVGTGPDGMRITTGYMLARRNGWSMKVRATAPEQSGEAALRKLLDGIDAVGWNWSPSKPPQPVEKVVAER